MCVVRVVRGSKGRPGKMSNLRKRGIAASYPLSSRRPTQGCFTWGNAAEDNYRLDAHTAQPLPYTVEACKAD